MATLLTCVFAALLCLSLTYGSPCPEDWIFNDGQCYAFGSSHVSWAEASAICSLFGASLAEVESLAENDFIALELRLRKVTRGWVGATDQFSEGNWQWIQSKNDFTAFSDWSTQEASDLDEEDNCLVLDSKYSYQWTKDRCNHEYSFVCETKSEGTVVG